MLIAFSGLPGTGKTSIARELAKRLHATYLRIDTIEQAIVSCGNIDPIMEEGYETAIAWRPKICALANRSWRIR